MRSAILLCLLTVALAAAAATIDIAPRRPNGSVSSAARLAPPSIAIDPAAWTSMRSSFPAIAAPGVAADMRPAAPVIGTRGPTAGANALPGAPPSRCPQSEEASRADRSRPADGAVFTIGTPDESAAEFGLGDEDYTGFAQRFGTSVVYTVGTSTARDWPFIHPSTRDTWAGGKPIPFTIKFQATADQASRPLYLIVGIVSDWEPSKIVVEANGREIASRRLPIENQRVEVAFDPTDTGIPTALVFPVPADSVKAGDNSITITLDDGSWITYDYVRLTSDPNPPKRPAVDLKKLFLNGPMAQVQDIVFSVRRPGNDGHWYANFAYDANDPNVKMYNDGGKLCRMNLRSGKVTTLLADPKGGVRDPQVDYSGRRILFSYRKGGTPFYHLFDIDADGSHLRQLTDGPFDDIEPTYLPDGDIVFVSSRCKRWVNCWRTPVAILYRCGPTGSGIHQISGNTEQDNTPWPLPDGRLLYTRWEYVDRSQVHYHHLWTANPDGTCQMVYYGNQRPGTVMIDAKPIPGSHRIVAIFSPGHGQIEHSGAVTIVDPNAGPDQPKSARRISRGDLFRDPWAFSEDCFMTTYGPFLELMDGHGDMQEIYRLPGQDIRAGMEIQEPRPLIARPREHVVSTRIDPSATTAKMILADVNAGRNMGGVRPGEIKKLLVLESLPKPVNFTGGMEPLSYGGTFTLERLLGTVPVEPDGSAYFEVPALRAVFFVALDANDVPVKRMQSFCSAGPGEVIGCVGCHEQRERAPAGPPRASLLALRRPPSQIRPIPDVPAVMDFTRDIQPILNRRCLGCHDWNSRSGGVVLSGDRGPFYNHSYFELFARDQVSDGRNRPRSNYAPRTLGSVASPLMAKLDPSHHGVQTTELDRRTIRLWIDSGAPHAGTYATLGTGMIGGFVVNALDRSDLRLPATQAALATMRSRCASCHTANRRLPESVSDDMGLPPWLEMGPGDPRRTYSNHLLYNLTRPEQSILLLAPLAASAGGYGICRPASGAAVFASTADPGYQALLASVRAAKDKLDTVRRFDMPGFRPHPGWIREMVRYGVLTSSPGPNDPIDVYAVEDAYWRSLWYQPAPKPYAKTGRAD
jgi:mono/diheme cytochrome c family protein